jgi:hypothetical protein
MFCPKCKSEFIKSITICPECSIPLVKELPENEFIEFVKLCESPNPSMTPIIKSILDSADIQYFVRGENMQMLFGGCLEFTNPRLSRVEFLVSKEDKETATELIKEIEQDEDQ